VAGHDEAVLLGNKLLSSVDLAAHVVARFRRSSPARRRDADEHAHDPSKTRPRGCPRVGLWQLAGSDHVYPVVRRAGGRRYGFSWSTWSSAWTMIYAKVIVGQEDAARQRVDAVLGNY